MFFSVPPFLKYNIYYIYYYYCCLNLQAFQPNNHPIDGIDHLHPSLTSNQEDQLQHYLQHFVAFKGLRILNLNQGRAASDRYELLFFFPLSHLYLVFNYVFIQKLNDDLLHTEKIPLSVF